MPFREKDNTNLNFNPIVSTCLINATSDDNLVFKRNVSPFSIDLFLKKYNFNIISDPEMWQNFCEVFDSLAEKT